ncbi:MAG TPA: heme NO-binding domain-containing protein [Ktedonobacteraceae bacterium]|nr:heme NO-binding domain-containing protein [Ktedonobacteraceae bacterium]
MHGLVFVTWEKYLAERFKGSVLAEYRDAIGETPATSPLASRVYDDAMLLAGVGAASRITGLPPDRLLHEYGHYFITNGLTRHLCAYLLTQVHSGRDLLLAMHDAHEQMSRLPDGLAPPLFKYAALPNAPDGLVLIYDSPRKLCSVLVGAIEGAAERYDDQVYIVERTCMKRGDAVCRFELRFSAPSPEPEETPEQKKRQLAQQQFAQFIFALLPAGGGVTLAELQTLLKSRGTSREMTRPALLLEALRHLHYAGLVATSANQPGDDFTHRRYWRAPTSG